MDLYDSDFYLWIKEQAELLKSRQLDQLDFDNLIEEVESLGRNERFQLVTTLAAFFEWKLRLKYAPSIDTECKCDWMSRANSCEYMVEGIVQSSPSLREYFLDEYQECYEHAVKIVNLRYDLNIPTEILPELDVSYWDE